MKHYIEHVLHYCDDVVVLYHCHVMKTFDVASFFQDIAILRQLGINPPAVVMLREALRDAGFSIGPAILTMEQLAEAVAKEVDHHE